jgi:hypothetical protein
MTMDQPAELTNVSAFSFLALLRKLVHRLNGFSRRAEWVVGSGLWRASGLEHRVGFCRGSLRHPGQAAR